MKGRPKDLTSVVEGMGRMRRALRERKDEWAAKALDSNRSGMRRAVRNGATRSRHAYAPGKKRRANFPDRERHEAEHRRRKMVDAAVRAARREYVPEADALLLASIGQPHPATWGKPSPAARARRAAKRSRLEARRAALRPLGATNSPDRHLSAVEAPTALPGPSEGVSRGQTLDQVLEERMQDPAFAAAFEAALERAGQEYDDFIDQQGIVELRRLAKEAKVPGLWKMSVPQLRAALKERTKEGER